MNGHVCNVSGCARPVKLKGRGICGTHYMRILRAGKVAARGLSASEEYARPKMVPWGASTMSDEEFWGRVDETAALLREARASSSFRRGRLSRAFEVAP